MSAPVGSNPEMRAEASGYNLEGTLLRYGESIDQFARRSDGSFLFKSNRFIGNSIYIQFNACKMVDRGVYTFRFVNLQGAAEANTTLDVQQND